MAHFLVLSFPLPGHVNPTLEFARRLVRAGALVTFVTTVSAYQRMIKSPAPEGLSYASFSDGYDDGFDLKMNEDSTKATFRETGNDRGAFMAQFRHAGARTVSDLVRTLADEGRPVSCIVYSNLQSWAADVACDLHIPSVVLWIQPAAVLAIYYHYFHGCDDLIKNIGKDPSFVVELQGLPPLTAKDLPSFLLPTNPHTDIFASFREQFETLDKDIKEIKPRVLVNTFEALERNALGSVDGLHNIAVGPLIPAAFLDGKDDSNSSKKSSNEPMEWLDLKPVSSVVYISFGSIVSLPKRQGEEILEGLLESGRPFLWAMKAPENETDTDFDTEIRSRVGVAEEGLMVSWCSQVEVLSHTSTGCFVTHCGWNSTLESLATGVPMVCFPQLSDQTMNAKLVEDVWKMGARLKVKEDGMLEDGELKRCLEEMMGGERGEEIRKNAVRWRNLAREAVGEGGSADRNIEAFMKEVRDGCWC